LRTRYQVCNVAYSAVIGTIMPLLALYYPERCTLILPSYLYIDVKAATELKSSRPRL